MSSEKRMRRFANDGEADQDLPFNDFTLDRSQYEGIIEKLASQYLEFIALPEQFDQRIRRQRLAREIIGLIMAVLTPIFALPALKAFAEDQSSYGFTLLLLEAIVWVPGIIAILDRNENIDELKTQKNENRNAQVSLNMAKRARYKLALALQESGRLPSRIIDPENPEETRLERWIINREIHKQRRQAQKLKKGRAKPDKETTRFNAAARAQRYHQARQNLQLEVGETEIPDQSETWQTKKKKRRF